MESWNTEFGPVHHCSENPCHTLREKPRLKEKRNAMTTGASDHTRYPMTIAPSP
jgi:hypothetical protein